jgi:hypothetical protein
VWANRLTAKLCEIFFPAPVSLRPISSDVSDEERYATSRCNPIKLDSRKKNRIIGTGYGLENADRFDDKATANEP